MRRNRRISENISDRISTSFSNLFVFAIIAIALLTVYPACTVNVKKAENGEEKQVDIKTPVGGIHVSKGADVRDTGLAVYPGARQQEKDSDDNDKSANVNISSFGFGLKVVAVKYESDDAPAKLLGFYRNELKKYGKVLECHSSSHINMDFKTDKSDSDDLTCEEHNGNNVELKVGTKENQHIVSIEPNGKGSSFALVYIRTHGKEADI